MNPKELIGLFKSDAQDKCAENNLRMRIVIDEGKACIGTCDFRTDRVNVVVKDGKVKKIHGIG